MCLLVSDPRVARALTSAPKRRSAVATAVRPYFAATWSGWTPWLLEGSPTE